MHKLMVTSVVENVLEKLIAWAEAALETSSNQPILPYVILALNASEHGSESDAWDVQKSTESVLQSLDSTLDKNVVFDKYVKLWTERGRQITSVEELLSCYFSSFKVVFTLQFSLANADWVFRLCTFL